MRVNGTYEKGLMSAQLEQGAGIFACDDFLVIADGVTTLGRLPADMRRRLWGYSKESSDEVVTHTMQKEPVWTSKDGTAANTLQFLKAWDVIVKDGRYRRHSWTVKVDPDAVLLPSRLRQHVLKHTGNPVFIVNCNKYPDSGDFPMMYGPVEAFSVQAINVFADRGWHCASELPWAPWGEDFYMTHCMDYLGVKRVNDYDVVGDGNCMGHVCGDGLSSAYHPFKEVTSWMHCFHQAVATMKPVLERFIERK
jgi:hypothetical protein